MKNGILLVVIVLLMGLAGCSGCNKSKGRPKPDVSAIEAEAPLLRLDKDLYKFAQGNFAIEKEQMQQKYGPFFEFYVSEFLIGANRPADTIGLEQKAIQQFISDRYMLRVQDSINKYFAETGDIEAELSLGLKYFKHYFPKIVIPKVVTVNSGLSLSAFTYDEEYLAVGLDMYLGRNNPDYDSAGIYQYLQHKMEREYVVRNALEALLNLYFGESQYSRGKTLMDAMTEKGKKIYALSYLLPDAPDSILVGFTSDQIKWCEQNEYEIWKFLNDKDILYKDDYMDHKRYLDEGPITPGMPAEAPGNIGSWIGLQIVRKFMKETGGKIELSDLILKHDPNTIAAKSKYRPSKSMF